MEPKSSEQMPTPIEYTPQAPQMPGEQTPDVPIIQSERQEALIERAGEQLKQVTQAATVQTNQTASPQLPTPVQANQTDDATLVNDDVPATANDDDLIEKEWVDKAKKIIAETKEDPHKRERAVNKLQIEYLKKRYGKELGSDAA